METNRIESTIPNDFKINAAGHLVPIAQIREQDLLRDNIVTDIVQDAANLNKQLSEFKLKALNDIADLVSIAAEKYGVMMGGKKGNVSLTSFDGRYKVVRANADRIVFTEELEAAKELITHCIDKWTQGSSANVQALVDRAFKKNAQGQIKTAAVLDLLRLEIEDESWQWAMLALKDSIQVNGTATYIRIYERVGDTDQYKAIPLDLAAV